MSDIPSELKYTSTHEWAGYDKDENLITIGITHHAQHLLGDIVFVELPEVGSEVISGKEFGVVESVKAASDLYSPVSGSVVEVNEELLTNPALINHDAYHEGWIVKINPEDISQWEHLMDADEYADKIVASK